VNGRGGSVERVGRAGRDDGRPSSKSPFSIVSAVSEAYVILLFGPNSEEEGMSIGSGVEALEGLRARITLGVGVGLGVREEVGEGVGEEARVQLAARVEGWPAAPRGT